MKRLIFFWTAGLLLFSTTSNGSELAQARLYCMSLRFQQGSGGSGTTLNLSSTGGSPYNGELFPYSGREYASYFFLYYGGFGTIPGVIYVNLPASTDQNSYGFDDFFEVSQGVSAVTSGSESTTISSGSVTATWSRPTASPNGTCRLHFVDDTYGDLGNYNCPFTLIEYTGSLTYMPGSNTVSTGINLAQTGNSARTLQGPIHFVKSKTDPFNTLTNQPGVWTNDSAQLLGFDNRVFTRGTPAWPTNYAGYIHFADGNPGTTSADYQFWVLSIDDTNDANANGIPDFSDDPSSGAPPHASLLSLSPGPTNLLMAISGDIGHTNQIQEINSLAATNWQVVQTLVLTNSPQALSLPRPAGVSQFWRVVAW